MVVLTPPPPPQQQILASQQQSMDGIILFDDNTPKSIIVGNDENTTQKLHWRTKILPGTLLVIFVELEDNEQKPIIKNIDIFAHNNVTRLSKY